MHRRRQNAALDLQELWRHTKDKLGSPGIATHADYTLLLRSCGHAKALPEGRHTHYQIIQYGLDRNSFLGGLLVQMYGKCGALEDALVAFETVQPRNVFCWNFLIAAYARHHRGREALQLLDQMKHDGIIPDKVTFISILSAFASQEALSEGQAIHAYIKDYGFESDIIVGTALVDMYSKCGSLQDARGMFEKLPKRDVVSWTAIIDAYIKHGRETEALQLFHQMLREEVIPDGVTFTTILNACGSYANLAECKCMHDMIVSNGFEADVDVASALLNMYAKSGNMEEAQNMFDKIPKKKLDTWNAMLTSYTQFGWVEKAANHFHQMLQEGIMPDGIAFVSILQAFMSKSTLHHGKQMHVRIIATHLKFNIITGTALMNMYGRCNSLKDAQSMFDNILDKNVVVWSAMMSIYAQHGLGCQAIELFDRMQGGGVLPNIVTYVTLLDACGIQRELVKGKQMHACIVDTASVSDVNVVTALVILYGKCGNLEYARCIFEKTCKRDVVLWTAMITVHVQNSQDKTALQLFNQMQLEGVVPNKVTYISILEACASLPALEEGRHIHACIADKGFASNVEMGTALVNMYGKCGAFRYAHSVFEAMPVQDTVSWTAMIVAYAQQGQGKDALKVFQQMVQQRVIPDGITFLSILSACNHSGLVDVGFRLFVCMTQDYNIAPTAGHYSCIIDLLGRAGQLNKAEYLINSMPVQPTVMSWTSLLGACRHQLDVERGERAAGCMFALDPQSAALYITLSNLYAAACSEDDVRQGVG